MLGEAEEEKGPEMRERGSAGLRLLSTSPPCPLSAFSQNRLTSGWRWVRRKAAQSSQRETRQWVPPFPFPPNTSKGGLSDTCKRQGSYSHESGSLGTRKRGRQSGEKILGKSSNSIRTDPEASELCTGGKDDSCVCYFSEMHLSGSFKIAEFGVHTLTPPTA